MQDKQNPVDVAKAFGRTKEATLFDLQEVRDDLDNITQKENALVVVSDKSKELREVNEHFFLRDGLCLRKRIF